MAISLASVNKSPQLAPPRIVLYAPQGVGKTTFGSHAPGPIILPFEDGIGTLQVEHFPVLKSWGDGQEALAALCNEEHAYQTAVVDTLDWLEPLVWAETCARNKWNSIEDPGFGKGYVAAAQTWREFFAGLDYIRATRGLQIILLAHTHVKTFHDPVVGDYDRFQIKLHERSAAIAEEWADAVLFANHKTYLSTTKGAFNKESTRGVGTGERVLYTEGRPGFKAKNRYSLPPELPFTYQALHEGIFGKATPASTTTA